MSDEELDHRKVAELSVTFELDSDSNESKLEDSVSESQWIGHDEHSVSQGNFNNKDATTPDLIQTSRKNSTSTKTIREGTLIARRDSAGERNTLGMNCKEDGRKSINCVAIFGKANALTRSKVPESPAVMKASEECLLQLQSTACESPEDDPFCLKARIIEDPNDSLNTTDSDLNTKQEVDDSTSSGYHGRHSDNQEETNHVSEVTDSITQHMNRAHVLQNNQELEDNSIADEVKPSLSKNRTVESVENAPGDSVIASEVSKPSVSDDKPRQKPSKFRQLWAQRISDPPKSIVPENNLPLLPSVFASPPAVVTTRRLQKVVPTTVESEPEPGKNWGARVTKTEVPQEARKAEENPVDFARYKSSAFGFFLPEVWETSQPFGVTSQATFRTESVEEFRTESKHWQYESPRETSVSTPAREVMVFTKALEESSPAPVAEILSSSEETTDAYICYVIEKINKLKLKDFPHTGECSTNFPALWENEWKQKNEIPFVKAIVRQHFEALMNFLTGRVAAAEDIFIENICFPIPVKMDRELGKIFDVPPSLITELPDDFITVLHSAISAFREEYRQRNRQILVHETKIREILVDQSVDYFNKELYFQTIEKPDRKFVEQEEFMRIADDLRENVTSSFFTTCSPDIERAKLEQRLNGQLETITLKMKETNKLNEAALDVLLAVADAAIDVYENSMKQFEMGQSIERRKDMFKGHDQAAHSQALQNFEAGCRRAHSSQEQHQYCLKGLIKRLDSSTNIRWGSIVQEETRIAEEQARKAREQARIAQEEDNRRKKEEADRREREYTRQLAHTEIRSSQPSHSQNFNVSNDTGNKQQWWLMEEDCGKEPRDPHAQHPGASTAATNNSFGFNWINTYEMHDQASLPSAELAIHMGLHHTQVAFITPATGKFNPVANVRNRLYWNEHELTPAFVEVLASGPPVINFEEHIAWSADMAYNFFLYQRKFSWDLADVLSQFLICLKRQAEVDSRMEFNACVVAVPQFLNDSQRQRVRQSAMIAGFDRVTFVNDTTAVAVVHMVDEQAIKGNVVVVNTQEGPIDVASFAFDHGRLECHGVTGDYFIDDQTDLWSELKDTVKQLFVGHPKNFAKKFFTQNELGISLSSPNTKFLLLGKGENRDVCCSAIRKVTRYAKDDIHDILPETVVYGTAFICCLRSRDPCNSILLKWHDKLQPSSETIDNKVLNEVERRILRPERELKKNMNVTTGYLLTSEEAQHRRTKLNTSNKAVLHRERLGILKLMDSVNKLLVVSDEVISASVRQDVDRYYKQLFHQDINPEKLKEIEKAIITLRETVLEMQGPYV